MIDDRPRVVRLHRMNPSVQQDGYWYYTPDGHVVGPFDSEEEREEELARYYKEVPHQGMLKLKEEIKGILDFKENSNE